MSGTNESDWGGAIMQIIIGIIVLAIGFVLFVLPGLSAMFGDGPREPYDEMYPEVIQYPEKSR